jgi:acetoin utilization deacetylase AcuC-like enzyme
MPTNQNKVGVVWDERYLAHDTGDGHPERPERLVAIKQVLDADSRLIRLPPRMASAEEVGWIHTPDLIRTVESSRGIAQGYFDMDTPIGPKSADAAFLAAGGVLEAVQAVEEGKLTQAFAFPRPPGHHAESGQAMGFCLFNHIAVAAEYLIRKKGKARVAIMDYDVHHGNGTQHSFYARKDVFYLSTHRFPFYPGTGAEDEKGVGDGLGYTLNVPFGPLGDDDDYEKAFDEQIIPALEDYKPEFVLVSAGFDAHERDPLGGMKVSKKGFYSMSQKLARIAQKHCGSKIVFVLEGGYDLKGLQEGVEAVLEVIR